MRTYVRYAYVELSYSTEAKLSSMKFSIRVKQRISQDCLGRKDRCGNIFQSLLSNVLGEKSEKKCTGGVRRIRDRTLYANAIFARAKIFDSCEARLTRASAPRTPLALENAKEAISMPS